MKFKAYAKINLSLDVTRKRDDGYHELRMIMHSVDLYDDIDININDSRDITLKNNLSYLPCDRRNLAYRAAEVFFEATGIKNPGISISVFKRIPVCAGMAGGSSDAACVLRGLNKLFDTGLSHEKLAVMGKQLGADVPYCVHGGTMLAEGIGEILTPLKPMLKAPIVIAKPPVNLSTPQVFKEVCLKNIKLHPDTNGMIKALEEENLNGICKRLYNVLEEPAHTILNKNGYPDSVENLKNIMLDCGAAGTLMSGSGPTVFGIFYNTENAEEAHKKAKGFCETCILTTT